MGKIIDLTGQTFGRLTVISYFGKEKNGHHKWKCVCECGLEKNIQSHKLINGETKSCGCLRKEIITKHNRWGEPEYRAWSKMLDRCNNNKSKEYKDYGGRGINVCDKWLKFNGFFEDMGEKPNGTSIDRINNNGNYCKENCRWATNKEQQNNKRNNINITYKNRTQTLAQWSRESGIGRSTLINRIRKMGWSIEKAFSEPIRYSH